MSESTFTFAVFASILERLVRSFDRSRTDDEKVYASDNADKYDDS